MVAIAPKEAVKDAILDATDRLLALFGYRKMTVEDIAAEAGIGKGTIYLHFSSKEEVVLSHIDRIVDRLKERLREIAHSDAPTAERLRLMLLTRVLFRFDSIQKLKLRFLQKSWPTDGETASLVLTTSTQLHTRSCKRQMDCCPIA